MQGKENPLSMRNLQCRATLSNHRPHTRNEQVSGSSPLVGSRIGQAENLVNVQPQVLDQGQVHYSYSVELPRAAQELASLEPVFVEIDPVVDNFTDVLTRLAQWAHATSSN